MLGYAARPDPVSRVSGFGAHELNGVTGEKDLDVVLLLGRGAGNEEAQAARVGFSGPVAMCTRIVAMVPPSSSSSVE